MTIALLKQSESLPSLTVPQRDAEDDAAVFATLRANPRRLLRAERPVTASLLLALERSACEVLADADPQDTRPAIVLVGEALVRRALRGDVRAASMIADRTEGRAGMRPDEVAPEDEARRGDMQAVIESVVTALVGARLAGPDDSPEDSASDRTSVTDAEAPR